MSEASTREIVLKYFHAWQAPSDWEAFRSCLAENVVFNSGGGDLVGADALLSMIRDAATPWKEVKLVSSLFQDGEVALMYDGVAEDTGAKFRVAEHIQVQDGKISNIAAAICPLTP